ncbi:MAG TPA: TAXI family TRAP transporter solute-binding subunit [Hyphomicrobiales bacterium]|nr:TAXI family TRAP transporter solute-binding subunit [Hyphomicrobiales bacterium]
MRRLLLQTLLVFVILTLAVWVAIIYAKPGPEGKIVLASGGAAGLYHDLAVAYKKELERFGVDVELRPHVEGIETLKGLFPQFKSEFSSFDEKNADIQAGFLKGGFSGSLRGRLASAREQVWHQRQVDNLRSVGRLFYEPLWVFYKSGQTLKSLKDLRGKTLYVGARISGTRRVVLHLLKANGVTDKNTTFIQEDMSGDAEPLLSGSADAALMILPPEAKPVQELLRNPQIRLMDFAAEADAYTNRFPALSKLVLRQGAVEFDPDIPSSDTTLLATSVALVVKADLDPALVSLLAYAVIRNPKSGFDKTGEPVLFFKAGEFPNGNDPEFELAPQAQFVYQSGDLPVLLRTIAPMSKQLNLPFWLAAVINANAAKSILLIIPLLSVIIPLMRFLPMLYNWSLRRRLLYWYRQLKALEDSLDHPPTPDQLHQKLHELERIDRAVSKIRVPLFFSDRLYDLRGHIDLVRNRLAPPRFKVAAE